MEYIDTYDDNKKFIGSFDRSYVHKQGLWHNTFQCWIVKKVEEKHIIIFQKRHPLKDTYPNLYDTSSAGHLSGGEGVRDGVRELKEELGIEIPFESLTFLGSMTQVKNGVNYLDREICNIFMLCNNLRLEDYKIQKEELCGLIEVDIGDFKNLLERKISSVHATGFEINVEGKKILINKNLGCEAFVPHDLEYYSFVIERIKEEN
jgi:isopentenyldiphosphate isomerase